jgi:hypothetical protein
MAKRNRIMYASQSVRANGHLLYRVQTLGSNTTFTAEDVFELGQLNRVDVVDDVPAVAVALDTNAWGDVDTMATLAGMNPLAMVGAPTASGAYLRTDISCTGSGIARYYHGVSLADFTLCNGVKIWAPVQNEASLGTSDDDIQMTLFMDKVFINSMTLTYNVGANSTEAYAAETDNKMWLVNTGRFVSKEEWTILAPVAQSLILGISNSVTIPALSNCKYAFLAWTDSGSEGITVKTATDRTGTVYAISTAAAANVFGYDSSTQTLTLPTNAATLWPASSVGYKFELIYAASAYAAHGVGNADKVYAKYFENVRTTTDPDAPEIHHADDVGAIRQGQIEVYLLDPDLLSGKTNSDWNMELRMQTVTITANPTRTPQNQLGSFRPFARSMNFPVEVTVNTTVTAADLEKHAVIAGLDPADFESGGSAVDMTLTALMSKQNLILVVKCYRQTDDQAGGSGFNRKAMLPDMAGETWYDSNSGFGTYLTYDPNTSGHVGSCTNPPTERPLKTVIVPGLKIVAEQFQNTVGGGRGGGAGATQEFNFRGVNQIYVVKGDVDIQDAPCIQRNSAAAQF